MLISTKLFPVEDYDPAETAFCLQVEAEYHRIFRPPRLTLSRPEGEEIMAWYRWGLPVETVWAVMWENRHRKIRSVRYFHNEMLERKKVLGPRS